MLKIKLVPIIFETVAKLDLHPAMEAIKQLYKPDVQKDKEELQTQMGFAIIDSLAPQLGVLGDAIPKLVAAYKGITEEEAGELDAWEEIKAIASDTGVIKLFQFALQKKSSERK